MARSHPSMTEALARQVPDSLASVSPDVPSADTEGKVSQVDAEYTDHGPHPFTCGNCRHYLEPDACEYVDGVIVAEGACRYWGHKEDHPFHEQEG